MEFFFNLLHTSLFLQICFLYVPITQEIIDKMSSPQNKKCGPWKIFGIKPPSNPATLWAGEALNAQIQGCLNITLAQKWYFVIFQISAEKSFLAWQKKFPALIEWIQRFCHMIFTNYNPQSCIKMCRSLLVKPGNFFLQKFEKCQNVISGPM